ncbi:MAG TPA: type II CAAX endopeptidase family protein [Polyangia bacterium]|jgi:membrane protease YdiL (CAAX protease family)|nr:type II CAAX endopeptidase family protein [Polyangia bacterium]
MSEAPRSHLDPAETLLLMVFAFALLWLGGGPLQHGLGIYGLALSEVVLVLGPALVWTLWRGVSPVRAWRLGWPGLGPVIAAMVAGAGGFYLVAALVESVMERILPVPPELRERLRQAILPPGGPRPFIVDAVALALLPALCEEALFRGALLGALRPAGRAPAVAATALLFGFYHGNLWKAVPTALLGALLGTVALRARSLWPAVAAHLANNVLVLLLVRSGWESPPPLDSIQGLLLVAVALLAVAVGLWALRPADIHYE